MSPMSEHASDLFAQADSSKNARRIYTVSQITQDVKLVLENTFGEIWVEGEISNFSASAAGHLYFSLKDDLAILAGVMFARASKEVKFKIENGLKVICCGRIAVYGPRSQYQIIIEKLEPKGIGSLQLALEQLKQRLEKEGLFVQEHKKPIPYLPARIGVVTSLQGAAVKDILKVLDRRFKDIEIIINPVKVQGEGAKEEIAQAINDFNSFNHGLAQADRIEVLIVGRGGGSIEDLWAFNEEVVARAIYASKIPVISAVGHERDWTIADLVADVRAATPSVAAELVIPKKEDLQEAVYDAGVRLRRAFLDSAGRFREEVDVLLHRLSLGVQHLCALSAGRLDTLVKKLALLNPIAQIQQYQLKITDAARQASVRIDHFLALKDSQFTKAVERLAGLSPLNILSRGYSITFRMPLGEIVKNATQVTIGEKIKTRLHQGHLVSQVTEVSRDGGD
jgi:exodeoxyribonuclease VII large subunit